jgi:hypothetical protein
LQLLDRSGPERVRRREQHPPALGLQALRQFRHGGRLPDSVHTEY